MDLSTLVVGVLGMVAIIAKVTDFVKYATNAATERRAIATQLLVWAGAVAVVFLYSASDFGSFEVGGVRIDDMVWPTKVILGVAAGSAASVATDYRKAFDGSDTAKVPSLNI